MTPTAALAEMSREDLLAAVDHFVKRIGEVVTEAEATKKQLARVQQHVAVVDALNQAQEREIADLKLELRRRNASHAELATRYSALEQRLDQNQQDPRQVRRSWLSRRNRN